MSDKSPMRVFGALVCLTLMACSAETFVDARGGITGQLVFTTEGQSHSMDGFESLSFDVGLDRRTTVLRMDLRLPTSGLSSFTLIATSGLTTQGQPSIGAPFSFEAQFPDRTQGFLRRVPLIGDLRATNVYLVCDGDDGLCGVGTASGRLQIDTSSTSSTRVEALLEFTTDPIVAER